MPKNPADDVPAPSVQDSPVMVTGAACPSDGTLVTCSGYRGDLTLIGVCPVCARIVHADAGLVSQTGVHAPDVIEPVLAIPQDPQEKEDDNGRNRQTN